MLYVIAAVGLAFLAMFGTIKYQSAHNATLTVERDRAVDANKSLAESIDDVRSQCRKAIEDINKINVRKQTATKKAKADAEKLAAAQRDVIDKLAAMAADPSPQADECKAAKTVLHQYATDATK